MPTKSCGNPTFSTPDAEKAPIFVPVMRIIFYGTPDFAVGTLDALLRAGENVVAVVTAVDKPQGRGRQLKPSAVKAYALEKGLEVLQPGNLKSDEFQKDLQDLQPDLQVVVAFRMMPEKVWNFPPKGTINLHASLLPAYRGAAPINWAIINGEKETGVSTFFLQHEIDTGNIIHQDKVAIDPKETAGTLHDKLMERGAALVVRTVKSIADGTEPQQIQDLSVAAPIAPKIFKEDCLINWNLPAEQIERLIRGLSPYPAAYTLWDGKVLKIFSSEMGKEAPTIQPGTVECDGKNYLRVACKDAWLHLLDIQMEGKKRMEIKAFLRGNSFPSHSIMDS